MNYRKFFGAASAALLIVIMVTLALVPGACAQSTYKTLHKFMTAGADGKLPLAGLIFDAAGNLYGTNAYSLYSRVYEIVHTGQEWTDQTIHVFQGGNDGFNPQAGLIFDAAGNAYGTTEGNVLSPGTVYQLSPQPDGTWLETVLYLFPADINGPATNLAMDAAGNLYGTTPGTPGNNPDKWGMVFELSPVNGSWIFTQLHHFTDGADGAGPSGVTLDSAGNLYGTSVFGGAYGNGLIWEITP